MKMKFFSMLALAAVVAFSSCGKEDPAEAVEFKSTGETAATISGSLLYIENITVVGTDQKLTAAPNVKIVVSVNYSALTGDATATGAWTTSVVTNNKGEFTVSVPATAAGVPVSFAVDATKGQQKQKVGADDKTIDGVWAYNVTTNAVVTNAGAAAGTPAATPGAAANPTVKQGQTIILPYTLGEFTAAKEADSKVI